MFELRQILCPTDFSELSYEALRIASHWVSRFHAHLDVLHVVEPDQVVNPLVEAHRLGICKKSHLEKPIELETPASASRELKKVAAEKVTLSYSVIPRTLTRLGKPAPEIVTVALQEGSNLIVMGTHGITGWRHLVIGSVTEAVVRTAPCLVLAVHEACDNATFCVEAPRKILCSTDFSEASYEGLKVASDLAREFSAELVLMHALEPFTGYSGLVLEPVEIETFAIADINQQLTEVLKERVPSDVKTRPLALWGSANEGIVAAAQKENADLIVIATHGLTGWRHMLLGSVAETVVRTATCSVLTVPISRVALCRTSQPVKLEVAGIAEVE